MCGSYRLSRRKQPLEQHFATDPWEGDWEPRYNIAPTQPVPVIRQDAKEPVLRLADFPSDHNSEPTRSAPEMLREARLWLEGP
jgi:putative SOS response-associated peptidase YedK